MKTTGFPSKRKGYILSQGEMDGICEVMKVARYFFSILSMKSKWIKVSVIEYRDLSIEIIYHFVNDTKVHFLSFLKHWSESESIMLLTNPL